MGWRYRKSINIGLGFRINISKNGIGYSWGVPGYRKTWKANGGTRITHSIPGTGISYVEETSSTRSKLPRKNSIDKYHWEEAQHHSIVNGKIDALTPPENKIFVDKIKSILRKNLITWTIGVFLIPMSVMGYAYVPKNIWTPIFLAIISLIISLEIFLTRRRQIILEYVLDDKISMLMQERNRALSILFSASYLWAIKEYKNVSYTRINAGASTNVKRREATVVFGKPPKYIKLVNDFKIYRFLDGDAEYVFLPDKIIVIKGFEVGALRYSDIKIELKDTNFVETEVQPSDAQFLHYTWQNVNNDGSPDRRFSFNRQIPVYTYKEIILTSATGMNLYLMVSSIYKAEKFKKEWDKISKIL